MRGRTRDSVKELFEEILAAIGCELMEIKIAEDNIHIFAIIPPKYSFGEIVRVRKSVSAREIFLRHLEVKRELCVGECWEDGYLVRTVRDKVTSDTIKR